MPNYLPLGIRKILKDTGWLENEINVYSALLERGEMDLTTIAQETGIGISTIQYTLKQLLYKKMLNKKIINNKPHYLVSTVDTLKVWVKNYITQFVQYESSVESFINQYEFTPKTFTSKVRFYEGYRGVKQSYRQMLIDCPNKEMCAIFSVIEEIGVELQDFFVNEYVKKRAEMGIFMRNIALASPKVAMYQVNDKTHLSETKAISRKHFFAYNTELNIYGDYVHFMSFDDNTAFALIINDPQLNRILQSIFNLLWQQIDSIYITDDSQRRQAIIKERSNLYPENFKEKWHTAKPVIKNKQGEKIMYILHHEVMSSYQLPYMKKLADIVTQNGGDILNIGYGLGLIDDEIEKYRESRGISKHCVIENNSYIAEEARKNKNLTVIEEDWQLAIKSFHGDQFDGIVYDGYPLSLADIHRDGVLFIKRIAERNLLKKNGVLTFYVDASESLGDQFIEYIKKLGFEYVDVEEVIIEIPNRKRQTWTHSHFLAPTLRYTDPSV